MFFDTFSHCHYFLQSVLERIKNTYCMGKRAFLYFYWSAIVSIAVCCTIFKLFTSDKGGDMFLPMFVCLSVCLSVSKITQKHMHGFV